VRREQDQALRQQVSAQAMPLWLFALIWIAVGESSFSSGVFVGLARVVSLNRGD
jgi:hypothetical protein